MQTRHSVYEGGCHCGAVRFRVKVSNYVVQDCNCSICRKKGFLHLIVPAEDFTLLSGKEQISTYTFNTATAKHLFCQVCGMHSFYHPRSHPDGIDVNVRCLDGNVLAHFEIEPFDGENWEQNVETIR
jgi:hypothetical protein